MSTQAIASDYAVASGTASTPDALLARLERLPITRRLKAIRVIVGLSTFFDAYTIIAIAFALPQLTQEWGLTPTFVGLIIAASYVGQLCGALFFGSLAEKIGRIGVLRITIIMFVLMDAACLFAWNGWSILIIRFLQGGGIGAEVRHDVCGPGRVFSCAYLWMEGHVFNWLSSLSADRSTALADA